MSRTDLEPRFLVDPWVTVIWLFRRDPEDEEEEEEEEEKTTETRTKQTMRITTTKEMATACAHVSLAEHPGQGSKTSQLELPQEAALAAFERGKGAV